MSPREASLVIPPLSPTAGGPLYQQIADGLRRAISEGRLAPGEALPSVRGLAEDLLVSVITVKRAYEDLERDGIIVRRQGLGTFVADAAPDRNREMKIARAQHLLAEALREGTEAGLSPSDVVRLLRDIAAPDRRGATGHVRTRG